MPQIRLRNPSPTVVADTIDLPTSVPDLPDDVLKRFPSLSDWEEDTSRWWTKVVDGLQNQNRFVSQSVTKANSNNSDLRVTFNNFTATVTTEIDAIVNEQGAQARRIVTVSAMAGVSQNIKIQNTPPAAPSIGDVWLDNSDLTLVVTYEWSGTDWVEVTDPITAAGVADERTARVTADGFLSSKYTLTVIAGNVVTGMNITSSTGAGTDISSVIFRATDFQIYNGSTGKVMFNVSGSDVQLAGTLTVSTSGKVYIGTGNYANADTAWYVDSTGQFSLKDKLTWNGTTLAIDGSITATTGTIGGWTIGATSLSASNVSLNSNGTLILGTASDVLYLSAADATYRLWAGNATAGSASFSVTKAGALFSTSGSIGGFTIGATAISSTNITLDSSGSVITVGSGLSQTYISPSYFQFGDATHNFTFQVSGGYVSGECISPGGGSFLYGSDSSGGYFSVKSGGNGVLYWDSSGLILQFTSDTNLYRNSANELKTDDSFTVGGTLKFGSHSAIGAETVTGFVTITDSGGTSRKLAVVS